MLICVHVFCQLQLKISFNESSLQSTYEYPSENSAWDSGEEEEEQEEEEEEQEEKVAPEQPSMVGRIHIPRPNIIASSSTHTSNSKGETSWNFSTIFLPSGIKTKTKSVAFHSWTNMTAPYA